MMDIDWDMRKIQRTSAKWIQIVTWSDCRRLSPTLYLHSLSVFTVQIVREWEIWSVRGTEKMSSSAVTRCISLKLPLKQPLSNYQWHSELRNSTMWTCMCGERERERVNEWARETLYYPQEEAAQNVQYWPACLSDFSSLMFVPLGLNISMWS